MKGWPYRVALSFVFLVISKNVERLSTNEKKA